MSSSPTLAHTSHHQPPPARCHCRDHRPPWPVLVVVMAAHPGPSSSLSLFAPTRLRHRRLPQPILVIIAGPGPYSSLSPALDRRHHRRPPRPVIVIVAHPGPYLSSPAPPACRRCRDHRLPWPVLVVVMAAHPGPSSSSSSFAPTRPCHRRSPQPILVRPTRPPLCQPPWSVAFINARSSLSVVVIIVRPGPSS